MAHTVGVFGLKVAIEEVQRRYFEQRPVLFCEQAEQLTAQIERAMQIIGVFNENLVTQVGDPVSRHGKALFESVADNRSNSGVDLDDAHRLAGRSAIEFAQQMVDRAKARTFCDFGDASAARSLAWERSKVEGWPIGEVPDPGSSLLGDFHSQTGPPLRGGKA